MATTEVRLTRGKSDPKRPLLGLILIFQPGETKTIRLRMVSEKSFEEIKPDEKNPLGADFEPFLNSDSPKRMSFTKK